MPGIRRIGPVAPVVAIVVVLLSAMVASRRVVLRDQLVLDRTRPYIHRSTFLRRVVNPIVLLLASRDRAPGGRAMAVLVVPGRRSGKPRRVPMDPPFEHEGQRYLVSPSGDTHWARNLRAAGEAQLCLDGRVEHVRAFELEGAEREAIVTAYAAGLTCDCRIGMAKLPDPADHPVFHIEPLAKPTRSTGRPPMGLLRRFWTPFLGVPQGPLGRLGAWLMTKKGRYFQAMAAELDLRVDDELLDVGCGSAALFAEHAGHVRYVAGLDASELQVRLARGYLAQRIAAGTAEIVLGDAADLPWEDGRFSVVTSLDALKFVPDPPAALAELHRVLRPGGRAVFTMGDDSQARFGSAPSGTQSAWGIWCWSDADAQRLVEEAGFTDVTVSVLPVPSKSQLVRAAKPAPSGIDKAAKSTAPAEEVVA